MRLLVLYSRAGARRDRYLLGYLVANSFHSKAKRSRS